MQNTSKALCASLTTVINTQMQEGFKKQLNTLHNLTHFQGTPPRTQAMDPHKRHRIGSPQSLDLDSSSLSSNIAQTSPLSPIIQDMDLSMDSTQDLDPPPFAHPGDINDWHQQMLDSNDPGEVPQSCLLYTSPSPRDQRGSRMPSSA